MHPLLFNTLTVKRKCSIQKNIHFYGTFCVLKIRQERNLNDTVGKPGPENRG